jgi:tetratricopeptide (TPR) repeat protein
VISNSWLRSLAVKSCSILGLVLLSVSAVSYCRAQTSETGLPLTDAQTQAKNALDLGLQAYKNSRFEEAVQFFTQAKDLDPQLLDARLYLANAYASQYIPGATSEDNARLGKLATEAYQDVLQMDSQNLAAIDGLASILYQRAGQPFDANMFEDSKTYHQKHIELKPDDPQPYYSVGVIDWALSYRGNTTLRVEYNKTAGESVLKDSDPLPEALRTEYTQKFESIVDEGIDRLNQAINLKPDYPDAMTYLNLLFRRKADMVSTAAERARYTEMADALLDDVVKIKQKNAGTNAQDKP